MLPMASSRSFSREPTDLKHLTTLVVIGAVILAGIAGVTFFVLSFRPSHFRLDPGHVLLYRLTTTSTELAADNREGRPTSETKELVLIGIGPDNLVALLAEDVRGRDRLSLHKIEIDGTAVLLDAAGRPTTGSRAIGIFDLNLFVLPLSATEQSWDAQLTYGLLPPAKQLIQAKARRSESKSNPQFQLKPPASLEWLVDGTYRQVKDLQATYHFRTSLHAVDKADLKCTWSIELPTGIRRYRVTANLELVDTATLDDDPLRLRAVAMDCAAATEALGDSDIGTSRRQALAANLRTADTGATRLRQLADRLSVDVLRQPTVNANFAKPTGRRVQIQVAIGPEQQKAQAEQLAKTLIAGGFQGRIEPAAPGMLRVVVGPLAEKDPQVLDRLQRAFPYLKPLWIEASP